MQEKKDCSRLPCLFFPLSLFTSLSRMRNVARERLFRYVPHPTSCRDVGWKDVPAATSPVSFHVYAVCPYSTSWATRGSQFCTYTVLHAVYTPGVCIESSCVEQPEDGTCLAGSCAMTVLSTVMYYLVGSCPPRSQD